MDRTQATRQWGCLLQSWCKVLAAGGNKVGPICPSSAREELTGKALLGCMTWGRRVGIRRAMCRGAKPF